MFAVNFPASLSESKYTFRYVAPFLDSTSFASEIAASSPPNVKELMPMSAPPLFASSLFNASSSAISPTHGPQVVNQKFTTVTALRENNSSPVTSFPSKSFPTKDGNFFVPMFPSAGMLVVLSEGVFFAISGNFSFNFVSSFSISRIFSASALSSFSSSAVNCSLADSIVLSKKSP